MILFTFFIIQFGGVTSIPYTNNTSYWLLYGNRFYTGVETSTDVCGVDNLKPEYIEFAFTDKGILAFRYRCEKTGSQFTKKHK